MGFSISKENIAKGLNTLNTFNSTEGNGTTRVLFTDEEVKAREYIKSLMQECGLTVTEDAFSYSTSAPQVFVWKKENVEIRNFSPSSSS